MDVPKDILVRIIADLGEHRLRVCRRVCHRWYDASCNVEAVFASWLYVRTDPTRDFLLQISHGNHVITLLKTGRVTNNIYPVCKCWTKSVHTETDQYIMRACDRRVLARAVAHAGLCAETFEFTQQPYMQLPRDCIRGIVSHHPEDDLPSLRLVCREFLAAVSEHISTVIPAKYKLKGQSVHIPYAGGWLHFTRHVSPAAAYIPIGGWFMLVARAHAQSLLLLMKSSRVHRFMVLSILADAARRLDQN